MRLRTLSDLRRLGIRQHARPRPPIKRATALISTDKVLAAEFQAILDQCPAPGGPAILWERAKERTAGCSLTTSPGAAHA